MTLPNIRIGNDLPISFFVEINKGGTLLTDKNTTIILWDPNGNLVDIRWSISGNQVSGTYLGAEQRYTGIYTLKVILNNGSPGMATSDRQMFRLVPHTWQGDTDPQSLDGFTISLTDVLSVSEMEELRDLLATEFPNLEERVSFIENNVLTSEEVAEAMAQVFGGSSSSGTDDSSGDGSSGDGSSGSSSSDSSSGSSSDSSSSSGSSSSGSSSDSSSS